MDKKKRKQEALAKQIIGSMTQEQIDAFEYELLVEIQKCDGYIIEQFDLEIERQQKILEKANVPLFYVSKDPETIKSQKKILSLIINMISTLS